MDSKTTTYGCFFLLCEHGHVQQFSSVKYAEGLKDFYTVLRRYVLAHVSDQTDPPTTMIFTYLLFALIIIFSNAYSI